MVGTIRRVDTPIAGQCTVCGRDLIEQRTYGSRSYCEEHLHAFWQDLPALWQASVATFLFTIVLAVIVTIVSVVFNPTLNGTERAAIGVGVSILPAIVWLVTFQQINFRSNVGFSPLIPTVFVLSMLTAAAISRPFLMEIVRIDEWLPQVSAANRLLATVLVPGFSHAFLLYAVIRYTVWQTPAFERRVDGVLYGFVAGWGYAITQNTLTVLDRGGLDLLNGTFWILSRTAAFLAASLVVGYFLGRNRFEDLPFYYLTAGVAAAAVLNGFLLFAGSSLNQVRLNLTSDGYTAWPGLLISLLVLIGTFGAVYGLFNRHNALTKARLERSK